MNSSISKTHVGAPASEERMRLSSAERILLLLPIAGGMVFGVFPLLLGSMFGAILGFPGNDAFIYRLAGAATHIAWVLFVVFLALFLIGFITGRKGIGP